MRIQFREEDLALRLENGYLRYKGEVYSVRVEGSLLRLFDPETNREVETVNAYDGDLDISNLPLGYVQITPTIVAYLSRAPRRSARHLLTNDSLIIEQIPDFIQQARVSAVRSRGFKDMLKNMYPSFTQATGIIFETNETITVAIDRSIALAKKKDREVLEVFFKNRYVGWVAPFSDKINTSSGRLFTTVEKALGRVGIV